MATQRSGRYGDETKREHRRSVKFTLADFGLDTDQVEAAFSRYRQRFGDLF